MGVLQDLKSTLGMGARANRYKVMLSAPIGPSDDFTLNTLCKGASIPAKTIGQIEVEKQGRKLVIAGDASYENTWTLTFWNTEEMDLKKGFEDWLDYIDNMVTHSRGASTHNDYMTEGAKIQQLSTIDNSVKAEYKFFNFWATNISIIDLADDSRDTITEFSVDFAFSHFERIS